MLVSVIVPTYNRARLISRAIESVNNQSYQYIEIVVVDDGSTDNTSDIVENLSRQSPRPIKYHMKNNGGCASARNKGLEVATGNFIAFLDSDDSWLPTAAETLVSTLIETGKDFVYSPAIEVFENGSEVINYPVAAGQPEEFAIEHFKNPNVRPGSNIFQRRVFSVVGRLDEDLRYNEDSDFIQRVAICCRAAYSANPTVKHFHHSGNKSRDRVAIYKALLRSTEKIIAENPIFAESLGAIASVRISKIKFNLVDALIFTGSFSEAIRVSQTIQEPLDMGMKLALLLKSTIPLKVERRCSWVKTLVKGRSEL